MFKVKIFKTIWAGDLPSEGGVFADLKYLSQEYPDFVPLEYSLELPFAPYTGISINDDKKGQCFRSGEIQKVTWFNHDNIFGCWVEDAQPYSARGYDYSYEWLVDRALKDGWVIVK